MAQKIAEVMTPTPVAVSPVAPLTEVAALMDQHGIGDVLVVDAEDRLCGLVTDRDIVVRAVAAGQDVTATPVREICSSELVTLAPDDDADTAVRLMREHAIRRIPVVEEDHPVGVISIGDLAIERDSTSALADISKQPPSA